MQRLVDNVACNKDTLCNDLIDRYLQWTKLKTIWYTNR